MHTELEIKIYVIRYTKHKGPRFNAWGTTCFIIPQIEKRICIAFYDFISVLLFTVCKTGL